MKSLTCFPSANKCLLFFLCAQLGISLSYAQTQKSLDHNQAASTTSRRISLDELVNLTVQTSESFQAIDKNLQALQAEVRSRDLELGALFTADLSDTRDERTSLTSQRPLRHRQLLETTFEKPFATGTAVSLLLSHQIADVAGTSDNHLGNWELTIAQDLWRNAFGRGTKLRRNSDKAEFQSRLFEAYTQRQNLLIEVERIYWDLALAMKEEQIRAATIQRSESLERWIRERVRKYAAESSDLFQVQALISQRRLELLDNRNRIALLQVQLKQLLPSLPADGFAPRLEALEVPRQPRALLATATSGAPSDREPSILSPSTASAPTSPQSLNALSSQYRLDQARLEAERVEDALRPSLQAYASHGRNGLNTNATSAWNQAVSEDFPATTVGVRLSLELDSDLKADRQRAAALTAEANALQARAEGRRGLLAWEDLQRQIENLRTQTEEAQKLLRFQTQKSNEEQRRYRQGRSTAFQAITFESDAALSELRLYQLFAAVRKSEAQARSFIAAEMVSL